MKLLIAGSSEDLKDLLFSFKYENMIRDIVIYFPQGPTEDDFFATYRTLYSDTEVKDFFRNESPLFIAAFASSESREAVTNELKKSGGQVLSFFSSQSLISRHNTISEEGVIIQMSSDVSNDVLIEAGVFIGMKCLIGHDVQIGAYSTLGPKTTVLGYVSIGKHCQIGADVTIMPSVKIGNNVKIGAGQLIRKDIEDNAVVL